MKELEYYIGIVEGLTSMAVDTWLHIPVLVLWTWLLPVLYTGLIWHKQKKHGISVERKTKNQPQKAQYKYICRRNNLHKQNWE